MAFKRILPRKGTTIPESHRPQGSINAALHELPAYRGYTHDLIGAVLFLPRTGLVVVPHTLRGSSGTGCVVADGRAPYPPGCHIDVSEHELQRAERVVLATTVGQHEYWVSRRCASGIDVRVLVEEPVVVEPDPVCARCGVWLTRPGDGISYIDTDGGHECLDAAECEQRRAAR